MMFKKCTAVILFLAIVAAFSTIALAAETKSELITPNRLTISWQDGREADTAIDTFRIRGFNVAQLRTLTQAVGGSVVEAGNGAYQILIGGEKAPFSPISFAGEQTVRVQYNVTKILDVSNRALTPSEPGWVYLVDYMYNWGSIRDVLSAMNLEIKSYLDEPGRGRTSVVIGEKSGFIKGVPPSGYLDGNPFYAHYAQDIEPSVKSVKRVIVFNDGMGDERIWIHFPQGASKANIYKVDYEMTDDGSFVFTRGKTLKSFTLASTDVLEYWTVVPEGIPVSALGIVDSKGKEWDYLIGYNGRDGGVNLSPVVLMSARNCAAPQWSGAFWDAFAFGA
jgi:hypothetical protein